MEALMIIGSAMSAIGAIKQGEAQQAQYQAQAQAQEYNAKIAENNARVAMDQANAQEEQQRRRFRMMQGEAIASAAQSGAGLSGSNKDIIEQNALMNELDALTIRYQGQNQAQGLQAQAVLDRYGAKAARQAGDDAMTAGYISAGANLLSGASKYQYYKGGGGMTARNPVMI